MHSKAVLKHFRQSPRKVRIELNSIRGKTLDKVMNHLRYSKSKASSAIEKIILSAAKEEGIKCGYHLVEPDKDKINELNDKGYNMIAFSVDIRMLDVTARLPFNLK